MKMTIDTHDMKEMFKRFDRDYYSWEGCETLLEYYDEIDENMEFDPVAICCDCTEYGNNNCCCTFENLIDDYGYKLDPEEWEENIELYIDSLCKVLEDYTTVLRVSNGNVIIFSF